METNNLNQMDLSVNKIDPNDFILHEEGLSEKQYNKALKALEGYIEGQKLRFLGYQANQKLNYRDILKNYLNIHVNNLGDPFADGNFTINSKVMEVAVLDYFAKLWHATYPHDKNNPDSYWGYTLSMGSTEGNVYALWNARDYLSGKVLIVDDEAKNVAKRASMSGRQVRVTKGLRYCQGRIDDDNKNTYTPIAFFSQDAHYSIVKAMKILRFRTFYSVGKSKYECPLKYPEDYPEGYSKEYLGKNNWPLEVPSNSDGTIYVPALAKLVAFFAEKGYPIYVNFNYGTTFKGAYDNVKEAVEVLTPILKDYNMYEREVIYENKGTFKIDKRNGFWFHVDGALGAAYMPFVEKAIGEGKINLPGGQEFPIFDFRIPEVHSISMSGHKWIGAPFPCGIYMTKIKYQLLPPDDPMYIGAPDTTFAGSRSGLAAMVLWNYAAKHSYEKQIEKVIKTEELAEYVLTKLQELEKHIQEDLWVERTPLSLTVRFKQPNAKIVFKYSLSCETIYVEGKERSYAHVYVMEHVTKEMIDELIFDLSQKGAFCQHKQSVIEEEWIATEDEEYVDVAE